MLRTGVKAVGNRHFEVVPAQGRHWPAGAPAGMETTEETVNHDLGLEDPEERLAKQELN